MEKKQDLMEIDIMRLVNALWHRAWAIVLAVVLFGAAAFSYTYFLVTPLYQASAMMYVNNNSISVGSTSVSLSDLSAAQSLVDTYIVILKSRTTLNDVIEQAEVDYSYEELYNMIRAASVNSTEVFEIVVTSPSPREAEKIANTIARILPDKISDIVEGSSVRVVDYAVIPAKKSSPSFSRNTALGMVIGFALICGVLIVQELNDEQIHSEEFLLQNYDLPILATVPDLMNSKNSSKDYYSYASSGKEAK